MDNEVIIVVKVDRSDATKQFAGIEHDASASGDRTADGFTKHFSDRMSATFGQSLSARISQASTQALAATQTGAGATADAYTRKFDDRLSAGLGQALTERIEGAGTQSLAATQSAGDGAGTVYTSKFGDRLHADLGRSIVGRIEEAGAGSQGSAGTAGDRIGGTLGEHTSKTFGDRLKEVSTKIGSLFGGKLGDGGTLHLKADVDKESFLARFKSVAEGAGNELSNNMRTGVSSVFSGDFISTIIKGALLTAVAGGAFAVLAPALGTVVSLAFGGGAIGAGIASALKDPVIQGAIGNLKKAFGEAFGGFGDYFKGPVLSFLDQLPAVIKPLQPMIKQIGADLGPIAQQLGQGVIGFLQNVLPSIGRAVDKSGPIIKVLADKLPGIGDALARLLDNITAHSDDAAGFFNALLDGISLLLRFLGVLVTIAAGAYRTVKEFLTALVIVADFVAEAILDAFERSFGWIPGLKGKFAKAKEQVHDWAKKTSDEINKVPDSKTFTLIIKTVGTNAGASIQSIGRLLGGRRTGGVSGAASGATSSGLTWTGEDGPELLDLPPGTAVHTKGDSARMAGGGGGGGGGGSSQPIIVQLVLDGKVIAQQLVDPMRDLVRTGGRGSVQQMYGQRGVR